MGIPSIKTIRERLDWLDKTHLGDQAAILVRQAMQYAETGEVGKTLEAYYETVPQSSFPMWFNDRASHRERISLAFQIMDRALETFGVEYIEQGLEYLNTGDTYAATVIYDWHKGSWIITSWGDIVERDERRFRENPTDMTVANTIAQQIGNRAFTMLGAKNLVGSHDNLTFKVGRNAKGVTHVRVTLDPSDTYTVSFLRVRAGVVKTVSEYDDIYVDSLHYVIEQGTGMYTSL